MQTTQKSSSWLQEVISSELWGRLSAHEELGNLGNVIVLVLMLDFGEGDIIDGIPSPEEVDRERP